jgi:hypothetical protein
MVAFQNSRYVDYGHLNVSIVNGRDKNVWPIAIVLQVLVQDWTRRSYAVEATSLNNRFKPWRLSS